MPVPGLNDRCETWAVAYDDGDGHGGPYAPGAEWSTDVAVDPSGDRVYVTGVGYRQGRPSIQTVAFDRTGSFLWVQRHLGAGAGLAPAVATSPDGATVYVTGASRPEGERSAFAILAYDAATGTPRWVTRWESLVEGGDASPTVLLASPDGSEVYVAGTAEGPGTGVDWETVAIDAATGAVRWSARLGGAGRGYDLVTSAALSPAGDRLFINGYLSGGGGMDMHTVAYSTGRDASSPAGTTLWAASYDGGAGLMDSSWGIAVAPDGSRVVVTGQSEASPVAPLNQSKRDLTTVAYDARSGAQRWVARWRNPQSEPFAAWGNGRTVAFDASGQRLVIGGQASGPPGSTSVGIVIGYDAATGTQRWHDVISPLGRQIDVAARSVSVARDGTTYVSGGAVGAGDAFTIALDVVDGVRRWTSRYNSSAAGADHTYGFESVLTLDETRLYVVTRNRHDWIYKHELYASANYPEGNSSDYGLLAYEVR